jgi:hypothetical protein
MQEGHPLHRSGILGLATPGGCCGKTPAMFYWAMFYWVMTIAVILE